MLESIHIAYDFPHTRVSPKVRKYFKFDWTDNNKSLAIVLAIRSGALASAYKVPFQGKPHFLIDTRLHKGTSGSPVITKLKNLFETIGPGETAWRLWSVLLGVNSSTWESPKEEEPLGLNAAVFASIVQHITKDSTSKDVSYQGTYRNGSIIGFRLQSNEK